MRGLLSSPRRRRRLSWGAGLVVAAGCAVAIGFLYPNTGQKSSPLRPGKPQVVHAEPESKPLPKADLIASEQVLDTFVTTAVLRQHLDRAYALVADDLRGGMGRDEWRHGNIPVVPFPAKDFAFAKSKLKYSHGNIARYDVLIWARPRARTNSTLFTMELQAVGTGGKRHWLVDYWEPVGGGIGTPATSARANPLSVAPESTVEAQPLALAWVLVPLSVLSLIVLVPIVLGVRGWLRNRRADREYGTKSLPPLKPPSS